MQGFSTLGSFIFGYLSGTVITFILMLTGYSLSFEDDWRCKKYDK